MASVPRCCWTRLKWACAAICACNLGLLLLLISRDSTLVSRQAQKDWQVRSSRSSHPFAYLLSADGRLTEQKKCTLPKLSFPHDVLGFAFQKMPSLSCSGPTFFALSDGYLIPALTEKERQRLKLCEIFAVRRESDNYSFLEKLMETAANVTIQVNSDFVYVKCYFTSDKETHSSEEPDKQLQHFLPGKVTLTGVFDSHRSRMLLQDFRKAEGLKPKVTGTTMRTIKSPSPYKKKKPASVVKDRNELNLRDRNKGNKQLQLKHSGLSTRQSNQITVSPSAKLQTVSNLSQSPKSSHPSPNRTWERHKLTGTVTNYIANAGTLQKNLINTLRSTQKLENSVKKTFSTPKQLDKNQKDDSIIVYSKNTTAFNKTEHNFSNMDGPVESIVRLSSSHDRKSGFTDNIFENQYHIDVQETYPMEADDLVSGNNLKSPIVSSKEFYDGWEDDDGDYPGGQAYSQVPNCDEEQFLLQVSPQKYVFDRYRLMGSRKSSDLNVLMFGIDSMSSLTFQRKLPISLEFLQRELDAVIFKGYNIVGDGTTQALLPMFLGKLQHEVPDILDKHLDQLDFVWKRYQARGYVTMFAEDEPHLGVFNLRLRGFEDQPTDHYMRYFWQAQRDSHLKQECSAQFCTGPTPNHQHLLQYLHDFFNQYRGLPHFAVGFSGELSHDDVNPSEYLDQDLKEFLASLKAEGYLNNTVVVVFADHGSRKGKFRQTLQGKMEERLPFMSMVFPESFKRTYGGFYNNLVRNARGLTSPFDIHETLLDLLDVSKIQKKGETKRGLSLFHPIPENRTCADAGIDTHWCVCVQQKSISPSDPLVLKVGQAVVSTINNLTSSERSQCSSLQLAAIHSASVILPNEQVIKFQRADENFAASFGNATLDMVEFQVTVKTDQCQGLFEATVQVHYQPEDGGNPASWEGGRNLTFSVLERDISRINTYRSQANCMCQRNANIMKFCCCYEFLRGEQLSSC